MDPLEIERSSPGRATDVYMNSFDKYDTVFAGSCIAADIVGVIFERLQDTFKECQKLKNAAVDITGENRGTRHIFNINECGKGKDIMEMVHSEAHYPLHEEVNRLRNLGQEDSTAKQGEDRTRETDPTKTDLIGRYTETALKKLQQADEDIEIICTYIQNRERDHQIQKW
ncbi:hypothetical protein CHS0354_026558 [Potamilus streckersoni]|uniref:Uncharacterized protein n=1 Tax=Potamilus streckersoni TaxID=2493646 RepID=A0AAE0VH09_9BIVA|nr:hypothetical protein CHS0354_026558 [Potamilus streckersoni]